ncbi:lytic transglycosylase domain-containing protein [Sphingopyxis sp.]|uniref:lytic transglycosylase domain-containing protein n=1 Tax=Sphingopyxis sp. TaxID=1908224 RepID=UPI002D779A38|nr:lytic transglycosylase domain-containing protein [Sphingopyxis sp.]HET6523152.1 lytic transglycosylase domain-containing protein [Sphingopyxis sp.]
MAAFVCASSTAHAAPPVRSEGHPYAASVTEAAQRFGIPEVWIWRVMHAESRGNRRAVSRAGAMGLMQVMPATWAMLTAKYRLGNDPFDARSNIHAGAAYLRAMWDRYGDIRLMLAAYNAGPGRTDAYAARRRGLPAETVAYVAAIAPELGSWRRVSTTSEMSVAAPGWRDAGLFAAPGALPPGENVAATLPPPRQPEDELRARPATLNPLFVTLSGKDR